MVLSMERLEPHVSYSVTELVGVTSLRGWSNTKVMVKGVLCYADVKEQKVALHEFGKPHNPIKIMVNIECVDSLLYLENHTVTVFGDFDVHEEPYIIAMVMRGSSGLNLQKHRLFMEFVTSRQSLTSRRCITTNGSSEMECTSQQSSVRGSRAATHRQVENEAATGTSLDWEDFEINIGWATMRGKMRGSGPDLMLGVHGWLDNANTFDLLAPHLPKDIRFLSLDLPGHGHCGRFPQGFIFDLQGYVATIKKTVDAIGWRRFTYLGHSLGAMVGIMYTSVFPEDIKALISIDHLEPWSLAPDQQSWALKTYLLQYFNYEVKAAQPAYMYTEEELLRKMMGGSQSLDERGARIMLQRGTRKVEGVAKRLELTLDLRVRSFFVGFITSEVWMEMAKAITCPLLMVKARDGGAYESEDLYKAMLECFKEDCQHFHHHIVEGKHHVHLADAGRVASLLTLFFSKLGKLGSSKEAP